MDQDFSPIESVLSRWVFDPKKGPLICPPDSRSLSPRSGNVPLLGMELIGICSGQETGWPRAKPVVVWRDSPKLKLNILDAYGDEEIRDLLILFIHLIVTLASNPTNRQCSMKPMSGPHPE